MISISDKLEGSALTVFVEGRLDTTTAPELEAALKEKYDSIDTLVLDFAKLEYISSAGLRVLISAQKIMSKKGSLKIVNPSDPVYEVFEITGLTDLIAIEK